MKILIQTALAVMICVTSIPLYAGDHGRTMLKIDDARAMVTIPNRPAVGYMKIHNLGEAADTMITANSPIAERIEIHTISMKNGVMRMRAVDKITVAAKSHVELKHGGFHLMIFGLKDHLQPGAKLPVTLMFKKAGGIELNLKVQGMGMKKDLPHGHHSNHGAKKH